MQILFITKLILRLHSIRCLIFVAEIKRDAQLKEEKIKRKKNEITREERFENKAQYLDLSHLSHCSTFLSGIYCDPWRKILPSKLQLRLI